MRTLRIALLMLIPALGGGSTEALASPITWILSADVYGAPGGQAVEIGHGWASHSATRERLVNTIGLAGAVIHDTGGIGATVYGQLMGQYHSGYVAAGANASLHFDDLIITSDDPSIGSVNALYSLALSYGGRNFDSIEDVISSGGGAIETGVGITGTGFGHAIASGGWGTNIAGQSFEGSLYQCQHSGQGASRPLVGPSCPAPVYIRSTYDPATILLQFAVTLPVNRPIAGGLNIGAGMELNASGPDGIALASVTYGSSLKFVTDRPVVELPAGFSANSASLRIVDGYYVGSQQVTPVPEPTSLLLLATGAAGLMTKLRRQREAGRKSTSIETVSVGMPTNATATSTPGA